MLSGDRKERIGEVVAAITNDLRGTVKALIVKGNRLEFVFEPSVKPSLNSIPTVFGIAPDLPDHQRSNHFNLFGCGL